MKVKAPFHVQSIEPKRGLAFWQLHSYRMLHTWHRLEWGYFFVCDLWTVRR